LIVGLVSVTYEPLAFVFMALFQNLAIGMVILLVMIVLVGLFFNPTDTPKGWKWLGVVGGVLFLWVMGRVFGGFLTDWFANNQAWRTILNSLLLLGIPIITIIILVIGKRKD
jgi:MFS family permease